jgi:oxygen-independent coproporphyrinogen-3 oxidase
MQGQTKERFIDSIKKALAYEPEEVFLYPLYIRQSSPLKRPQDDSRYLLYQAGRQYLMEQGYQPLSMRRFVQRGDQLVSSCGFSDTISLGCGGRSYIGNTHFCTNYSTNEATIERTIKSFIDQSDKTQITNGYVLNEHEMKNRFVLKNLFFSTGISEGEYQSQFASSLKDDFPILDTWGRKAFLTASNGSYNLTDLGFSLSDYLGPQLVEVK